MVAPGDAAGGVLTVLPMGLFGLEVPFQGRGGPSELALRGDASLMWLAEESAGVPACAAPALQG